ncbi:hypothetical protein D3C81_356830 [compost metagenome]
MQIIDTSVDYADLKSFASEAFLPSDIGADLVQRSCTILQCAFYSGICLFNRNRVPGAVLINGFDSRNLGELRYLIGRDCKLEPIQHGVVLVIDLKVQPGFLSLVKYSGLFSCYGGCRRGFRQSAHPLLGCKFADGSRLAAELYDNMYIGGRFGVDLGRNIGFLSIENQRMIVID